MKNMLLNEIKQRQKAILRAMDSESMAIIFPARKYVRTPTCDYRYRQNSDFYYITGFHEPDSLALLLPGRADGEYVLFNKVRDELTTIWTGELVGQEGAEKNYGVDQALPISKVDDLVPELMLNKKRIYFGGDVNPDIMRKLRVWVDKAGEKRRLGFNAPIEFIDLASIVHPMRSIKSAAELKLLRRSAEITANAHICAMRSVRPNMYEYEVEAEIMREFIRSGGRDVGYDSIVAGGKNACILHYMQNDQKLNDGELLLVDAGVEYQLYGTDVTRTFPINGKFSKEQALIYQTVLDTQKGVIDLIKPGVCWNELQELSEKIVSEKLLELGILHGSLDEVLQTRSFFDFYMHRIGHWLGLDNKDVGRYKISDKDGWRKLEVGMVFTVEPGIYIRAQNKNVDSKWWNIGVRIEDNLVVTANGCENLTAKAPREISEIEALMKKNA